MQVSEIRFVRHQEAAALGLLMGAQQAEEHVRLTGARHLAGVPLLVMAELTWKYEALPRIRHVGAMDDFVRGYAVGYRGRTSP